MSQFRQVVLKDGSNATIFFIDKQCSEVIPIGIQEQLMALYNDTIIAGQTYPAIDPANTLDEFRTAWLLYSCVVLVSGNHETMSDRMQVLGTFYVKPNYVGRCSHNCNAGFLVSTEARGQGLGKLLGQSYLEYAPTLGYSYSVFNLVFATNTASVRIWDSLGFSKIGTIPGAAKLRGIDGLVDAYIYGKKLI